MQGFWCVQRYMALSILAGHLTLYLDLLLAALGMDLGMYLPLIDC